MQDDIEMADATEKKMQNKQPKLKEQNKEKLPYIEKYRPNKLSDIISHEEILSTIRRFLDKRSIPHLLFHGPAGTGKTSCILALARELYGDSYKSMVLEMNASDDRGIGVVREQIKNFCSSRGSINNMFTSSTSQPTEASFKLVILDEADMMTSAAQAALRRVMEKYPKNCRFCIICNNVSKIIPAIQSRCMRFRFCPLNKNQCLQKVKYILNLENIKYDSDETLLKAIDIGKGDMRKILNLIESTSMAHGEITNEYIFSSACLPSDIQANQIYQLCLNNKYSFSTIYNMISDIQNSSGFSLSDLIDCVSSYFKEHSNYNINNGKFFESLAELDYADKIGANSKIILSNLICLIKNYNN